MEWIEDMNPTLRWILFIPSFFVVFFLVNALSNISLFRYIGPPEESLLNQILYGFQSFISFSAGLAASCYVAPKGKVIIASIIVGIFVLILGVNIAFLLLGKIRHEIILSTFISNFGMIISSVVVLVSQVKDSNKPKHTYLGG